MSNTVNVISEFERAAMKAATELGNETSFVNNVNKIIEAGETVKMSKITLFMDLNSNNGDLLASFPRLDTKDGNNPEFKKIMADKADGTRGEKTVSFYTVLARDFSIGANIEAVLADLLKRKNNNTLDMISYTRDMKKWTARKTALRSLLRGVGALYHQFSDFSECAKVKAYPAMIEKAEGVKELQSTANPIMVQDATNLNTFHVISVEAFLRLDVRKAIEDAGGTDKVTLTQIMATANRDGEKNRFKPLAMSTFQDYVSGVFNFTDANDPAIQSRIHKRDADGKALAVAMYRLQAKIGDMIDPLGKELAAWVDADDKATAAANAPKTGTNG